MSCIWKVSPEDRLCKYCLLTHCDERVNGKYRRSGTVMPTIRKMNVGDEIVFDHGSYGACRTAATRLGENFSVRIITRHEDDGIHVIRIS